MQRNDRSRLGYTWGSSMIIFAACGGSQTDWVTPTQAAEKGGQAIHIVGIIRHLEMEGGFYAIRGSDSVTYDPRNLPSEFQKDGLTVEADARRRDDVMGIHQVGVIVDLERIRAR